MSNAIEELQAIGKRVAEHGQEIRKATRDAAVAVVKQLAGVIRDPNIPFLFLEEDSTELIRPISLDSAVVREALETFPVEGDGRDYALDIWKARFDSSSGNGFVLRYASATIKKTHGSALMIIDNKDAQGIEQAHYFDVQFANFGGVDFAFGPKAEVDKGISHYSEGIKAFEELGELDKVMFVAAWVYAVGRGIQVERAQVPQSAA